MRSTRQFFAASPIRSSARRGCPSRRAPAKRQTRARPRRDRARRAGPRDAARQSPAAASGRQFALRRAPAMPLPARVAARPSDLRVPRRRNRSCPGECYVRPSPMLANSRAISTAAYFRLATFVARPRRRALEGFLRGIDRQHAERHRHARTGGGRDSRARAVAMYLEVRRGALDQAAETDDSVEPAAFGNSLSSHWHFERAGHAQHFNVALGNAGIAKRRLRADQQAIGDEIVEARDDNRYWRYFLSRQPYASRETPSCLPSCRPECNRAE